MAGSSLVRARAALYETAITVRGDPAAIRKDKLLSINNIDDSSYFAR